VQRIVLHVEDENINFPTAVQETLKNYWFGLLK